MDVEGCTEDCVDEGMGEKKKVKEEGRIDDRLEGEDNHGFNKEKILNGKPETLNSNHHHQNTEDCPVGSR